MGRRELENRKRKAAAKSCQSLDTWVSKVPRQEPSDADNDSGVCDDSPAESTTSDPSQLTTVLQRDIEVAIPRYETNLLNKKPVREQRVKIRRGTGRVNLKQQSTGIPNHQNRSFRDTKRENTFYASQVKIVLDEVVNLFATKHPRRLELGTILRD
ncbi:unnamed protein product [Porites lobata]|uniref:Uncharacterized protein n=1 Tax=Porites lobata TaxID=104759 RepID=A0ABN8PLD6_9CNID|nr:unnamed protein product [Porites lobata]